MPANKFQRKLLTLISFPISSSLYSLAMKTVKKEVYDEILRRLVQQLSDQEAANHFRVVAMLLDWNLSSRPFLGQVVNLDVLLCTEIDFEHAVLFLGHICTHYQRR